MENKKTWNDVKLGDEIYYFYICEYEYTQYEYTPFKEKVKEIVKADDVILVTIGEGISERSLSITNPNSCTLDNDTCFYYCDKHEFEIELVNKMQSDYEYMLKYSQDYKFKKTFLNEIMANND